MTRDPRAVVGFDALPGGLLGVVVVAAGVGLVGALAFGLWHVVVGGLINGNPRAGAFGIGLALTAGIALLVGRRVVLSRAARRSSRAARGSPR